MLSLSETPTLMTAQSVSMVKVVDKCQIVANPSPVDVMARPTLHVGLSESSLYTGVTLIRVIRCDGCYDHHAHCSTPLQLT